MRYLPLFSLTLSHSYYEQQRCPDLAIAPTPTCERTLQSRRLTLKSYPNGLRVFVPVGENDDSPYIPLEDSLTWTFLLAIIRSDFVATTQLDPAYSPSHSFYFFRRPENGEIAEADATELPYELAKPTQGQTESSKLADRAMAIIAELPPRKRQAVFGIVEIPQADLAIGQEREFAIRFVAKEQVWKYYAIAPKGTPADTFSVRDKDAAITFTATDVVSGDRVVASIQARFPDTQILLWKSTEPIAAREASRPNLQLLKAGQTTPWIAHLPNPPPQHGTQVINVLAEM